MYNALKPVYEPRGDVFAVTWRVLGVCVSMEDAKRRYGGYPVLQWIEGK